MEKLRRRALSLSITLGLSLFAACASEHHDDGVAAPSPGVRAVRPTLAGDRAQTARIPVTGGRITATGEDGTRFTLEIPDGGLFEETSITMTPVRSIEGLPFSRGPAGAVDLAPDGLRLYAHATLHIEPARAIPIAEQVLFGWAGEGRDFHLEPPVPGEAVALRLIHFSGYGVAAALPHELEAQRTALPAQIEARLQQELALFLADQRRRQLAGEAPDNEAIYRKLMEYSGRYEQEVLRPLSNLAGKSCAQGRELLTKILAHQQWKQVMGLEATAWSDPLFQDMLTGERNRQLAHVCMDEAYDRCVATRDPGPLLQAIYTDERSRQLLGSEDQAADPYGTQKLEQCRSQIRGGGKSAWTGKISVVHTGSDSAPQRADETRLRVRKISYEIEVSGTNFENGGVAGLTATAVGSYEETSEYQFEDIEDARCGTQGRVDQRIERGHGRTVLSGRSSGEASVQLRFALGQTYHLSVEPPSIPFTGTSTAYSFYQPPCYPEAARESTVTNSSWGNVGGGHDEISATATTLEANTLSGSHTEQKQQDGLAITTTITWNLERASHP